MAHVLLVTFPAQGHLNPTLRFAKRLTKMSTSVTYVTTTYAHQRLAKGGASACPEGITFVPFCDGTDDGYKHGVTDTNEYMRELKIRSSNALRDVILNSAEQGRPVTIIVYSILLPWAAEVARDFCIPSALLWIQPAVVFVLNHYYFSGLYEDVIANNCDNPNWSIQLPGLPSLTKRDLPSFLVPSSNPSPILVRTFKEHIVVLEEERSPMVLVNTFDALEPDALTAIGKLRLIAVGPLIPSAFLDGLDPSDKSFGGDLFEKSKDHQYTEWLDSKPESSVVYVSFGSMTNPRKEQMEEIASGLLETGRPFLWVVKDRKDVEKLTCAEELERVGMMVPWCSQLEVLSHPSLGCFVTHCGWNSTLESMACGVPLVAFPQWTDQGTNAKLIQDVWRTGVRVTADEDGMVSRDEIKRCVEMVMDGGKRGSELRNNAEKWKDLARDSMRQGGSSYQNLKALFL